MDIKGNPGQNKKKNGVGSPQKSEGSEGVGVTSWPCPLLFKNRQKRRRRHTAGASLHASMDAERPGEDEKKMKKRRAGTSPHAMGAERPEEKKIEDAAEEMLDENAGGRTRRARRPEEEEEDERR